MAERGQTYRRAADGLSVALDGCRDRLDGTQSQARKQVAAAIQRALGAPGHPLSAVCQP